jgi:hypothetical protein
MNSVEFVINKNGVRQVGFSWSHARNVGTAKIINGAFEFFADQLDREYVVSVQTADFPRSHYGPCESSRENFLAFDTVSSDFNKADLFPDFIFGNWSDIGLEDWDGFVGEILRNNSRENIHDERVFWSGSCMTSPHRNTYLSKCREFPEMFHGLNMHWKQKGEGGLTEPVSFVTWGEHCKYKYLLDIPGYSWGTRTKFIPFCNRPLFASGRKYWTWSCVEVLKHGLHVDIEENFGDLAEKYRWAEENQDLVFSNATQLMETCRKTFSFKNVCKRAADLILKKIS